MWSQKFYVAYLSSTRIMVSLFNRVINKENFIMLPGDEIIEKKHKNIKLLIAQERNEDLSRRETRKFPGLGASVFKIDFSKYSDAGYASSEPPKTSTMSIDVPAIPENEINTDVTIQNTLHHKAIIKARNEFYLQFKKRFEDSLRRIMSKYDSERSNEMKFNAYWASNLKEITVKHI